MGQPNFSTGGLVTDAERADIIRLHGEGHGRNEIARLTRRSQRTVSLICAEEGLVFDVTVTEEATRHRVAQRADRHAMLTEALQDDAERLTEQLWRPAKVFRIGNSSNTYTERTARTMRTTSARSAPTARRRCAAGSCASEPGPVQPSIAPRHRQGRECGCGEVERCAAGQRPPGPVPPGSRTLPRHRELRSQPHAAAQPRGKTTAEIARDRPQPVRHLAVRIDAQPPQLHNDQPVLMFGRSRRM